MRHGQLKRTLLPFVAILFATASVQAEPTWHSKLEAQIQSEEECLVEYYTNVLEKDVNGTLTLSGKIHCRDGRQFDFSRLRPQDKFDIKVCEPQVC